MIGGHVKCDQCNFIGEMSLARGTRANFVAPPGWALVSATVRIRGEYDLDPEVRKKIKDKVKEKVPPFHVCPRCIIGKFEIRLDRLLAAPKESA